MEQMHINFTHFKSEISLMDYFDTEDKCKAAIAQQRWGDGEAVCPYCGSTHTHLCKSGRYICKGCQRKFSVTVGTIFENTKVSLRRWFLAMYKVASTKKGVSSHQLARDIEVTQKTAWFMLHKIRGLFGITDEIELDGEVEMTKCILVVERPTNTKARRLMAHKGVQPRRRPQSSECCSVTERWLQ